MCSQCVVQHSFFAAPAVARDLILATLRTSPIRNLCRWIAIETRKSDANVSSRGMTSGLRANCRQKNCCSFDDGLSIYALTYSRAQRKEMSD